MRTVLGIDAAWTPKQPSGVATIAEEPNGWRIVAVESSYKNFCDRAESKREIKARPTGSIPVVPALLKSASALCNGPIDIVAVDMPLSKTPIVGRRVADNAVSKAYGGRKCGTHTPSQLRPGRISADMRRGFDEAGYPLLTKAVASPGLIEVYPHPALVELSGAPERLPYKAAKTRKYWPSAELRERRIWLYRQWMKIVELLETRICGVSKALPEISQDMTGYRLKSFEDALDAVICAWVGICALEGTAKPFGDDDSAIWIPLPMCR